MKFNLLALLFSMLFGFFRFGIVQDDNPDPLAGVGGGKGKDEPSGDELEKSLNLALEEMNKADEEYEDENEEDEDEDEYEEMKKKKMKKAKAVKKSKVDPDLEALSKSIPEMLEEDEEASDVMNAIPFVKALVDGLEGQMQSLCKAIINVSEELEVIKGTLRKSGKLNVAQATMIKSMAKEVRDMGDQTFPRRTNLGKNIQVMKKSVDGTGNEKLERMSKAEALDKLLELRKGGKIDGIQLTICEGRINKGVALDPNIERLLVS